MALPDTPLTRGEAYLNAIANESSDVPTPLTREEQYLNAIAKGDTSGIPSDPLTRTEQYLDYIAKNGGGGSGGKLPDAYQEVEYLQTSNYQGIAIGHSIGDADVTIDVSIDSTSSSETACAGYFDQNASANAIELFFENTTLNVWNKLDGTGVSTVLVDDVVSETRYRASFKSNPNLTNFLIGFYRLNYFPFKGKIYRAEIEKTGTFHAIFVPCYRKIDNKPGLYDTVNMSFFTNVGSADFTVGPDVN